jgi:RNA polymerase sigma-70 factor (ECF subfamily)
MTTCYPDDERDLIDRALAGDASAWETLFLRYSGGLKGYALKSSGSVEDAEDAVQEVWFRVLRQRTWEHREEANFRSFLYRVLRNVIADHGRGNRRCRTNIPFDGGDDGESGPSRSLADSDENPEEQLILREEYHRVASAVDRLTTQRRRTIILKFWAGLGRCEIAAQGGVEPDTVNKTLIRALAQLKARL